MSKWKIFNKSKSKVDKIPEPETTETSESDKPVENKENTDNQPIAEYHDTVYTEEYRAKKRKEAVNNQQVWRNVDAIEKKVDILHITRAQKPVSELDKKVDKLIEKRTIVSTAIPHRKPSNVIYVVSKPQPGEVRGDWAVRSHGKIFSHHKTKEKAIDEARKIARDKNATVMVQNTDGTFSEGFKPRKK